MADTTLLKRADKRGDVKLYKSNYISKTKKKSIDIQRASVIQLSNGKIRFKVRIKKIHKSKDWDQMVFFDSSIRGGDPTEYSSVSFKIRNSGGAAAYNSRTEKSCNLKVKRKGKAAWVDVPRRCAPWDGDTVNAGTATGHYQSDENLYSSDRLRLGTFREQD